MTKNDDENYNKSLSNIFVKCDTAITNNNTDDDCN